MSEYIAPRAQCKNCYRKNGERKEILQGANGEWVHQFLDYTIKCHPFEQWVAEPMEEE
jgi:hypothetical protein